MGQEQDKFFHNLEKINYFYREIFLELMNKKFSLFTNLFDLFDIKNTVSLFGSYYNRIFYNPLQIFALFNKYLKSFEALINNFRKEYFNLLEKKDINKTLPDFKEPYWYNNIFLKFLCEHYSLFASLLKDCSKEFRFSDNNEDFFNLYKDHFLQMISPRNYFFLNPKIFFSLLDNNCENFVKGLENFLADLKSSKNIFTVSMSKKEYFELGKDIATTPGKVIYQNKLLQLIYFQPKEKTFDIPIFIVPPIINKYYILDLSREKSLIRWLVEKNFQVFVISWVNPYKELSDIGFEDYVLEGVSASCEHLIHKLGYKKFNFVGYCIGGTLLAVALAYFKKKKMNIANSSTFLTTLIDFSKLGDLAYFINDKFLEYINTNIKEKGVFSAEYLINAFNLIKPKELFWYFVMNNYIFGKAPPTLDFLYWNYDSTNLTFQMYYDFIHKIYLKNLLVEPNSISCGGVKINMKNISIPVFALAAKKDHITLWESVYNSLKFFGSKNKTFCLTNAGHIAGVINPETNSKYSHVLGGYKDSLAPNSWVDRNVSCQFSWWKSWYKWLLVRSGKFTDAIQYQKLSCIEPSPGSYVKKNYKDLH